MKNEIQKVTGFKYDGVIYDSEAEALNAKREKTLNEKLHKALHELSICGEYRFDRIGRLIDELDQQGLEIALKK